MGNLTLISTQECIFEGNKTRIADKIFMVLNGLENFSDVSQIKNLYDADDYDITTHKIKKENLARLQAMDKDEQFEKLARMISLKNFSQER